MDAETLFVRRCEQAAVLMQSNDEAELLDLAGLLRQLLVDGYPLLDAANKGRVKPKFHVGLSAYPSDNLEKATFWSILDGLDPEDRRPGAPSAHLTRDQFLKHVVINDHGEKITIKDIIEHAANIGGGVHYDPRPKTTTIARVKGKVSIKGHDIDIYYLKGITKVALRGLQPIVDDIQNRLR